MLEGERRRYIAPAIPPAQPCFLCRAGAVAQVSSKRSLPYSSSLIQCSIVRPPAYTHLPGPFIHRIRKRHVERKCKKRKRQFLCDMLYPYPYSNSYMINCYLNHLSIIRPAQRLVSLCLLPLLFRFVEPLRESRERPPDLP